MADSDVKEMRNAVSELRDTVENRLEEEREQYGEELADTKEKMENIQDDLDRLETKLNRREPDVQDEEETKSLAKKALGKFLVRDRLDEEEVKAMKEEAVYGEWYDTKDITVGSSGNQSDALAPEEFVREIIKDAVEISPVRQVARTRMTDRRQVKIPVLQGRPSAAYVAEQGTRSDDTSTDYGADSGDMLVIDMHEYYVQLPISRQMERDSVFDVVAEARELVSTEMARFEGEHFLQGSGSGEPQGLVTGLSASSKSTTADTSTDGIDAITADEVIDVTFDVKKTYRDNGTYGLTREAIRYVRTLKDGNNDYLWQPGLADGNPPSIQGHPYVEMQDLVTSASAGDGDQPIVFGDWRRGYQIVDRLGMQVLRDPYSKKETGTIDYQFYAAHGGDIRLEEALQSIEIG